jgi:hypothetical protein
MTIMASQRKGSVGNKGKGRTGTKGRAARPDSKFSWVCVHIDTQSQQGKTLEESVWPFFAMCGGCGGPAGNISEIGVAGPCLINGFAAVGWILVVLLYLFLLPA